MFCLPDSSCKPETTELEIGSISQRHWPMEHFQIEHTQEQPRFQSGNSQRVFTLCLIDHNIMETIKNENKIKILKVAQNSLVICFHLSLHLSLYVLDDQIDQVCGNQYSMIEKSSVS